MKKQFFFLFLLLFSCIFTTLLAQNSIHPENITIIRDSYGVPHISAPTDPEVAYGLAWANAEDDFEDMQRNFLIGRCQLGLVEGADGAAADFLVAFLGIRDTVNKYYESDVSPKFKAYLEGFCQGINAFAAAHPKEIFVKNTFPVYPKDILTSYAFSICLMSGVGSEIQNIMKNRPGAPNSHAIVMRGSNGAAMSGKKTVDGQTYFFSNSHQPLNGPLAWYEAHLVSGEGMNVLGGLFPGGVSVFAGCTPDLAWMHTIAFDDYVDVFELEMHPKNKLQYKFDDQWLDLTENKIKLKVKVAGIPLSIPKKAYGSVYGPVLKNETGYFALRLGALHTIKGAEQWYQMDKATNFEEWKTAIDMQGLSGFNVIYADKEDNIFYQDLGQIPKRAPGYKWHTTVPGNTSKTLWKGVHKNDDIPWVKNPGSGFVFNTNNTPLSCSGPWDCPARSSYGPEMGLKLDENHRSVRLKQIFNGKEKFTYQDFKAAKYDCQWPDTLYDLFASNMNDLLSLSPERHPHIAPAIHVLNKWDHSATADNKQAALAYMTLNFILKRAGERKVRFEHTEWPEEEWALAVSHAQWYMKRHFGTLEIPFGEVNRLKRGKKEYPTFGMPDMISCAWGEEKRNGKIYVTGGDSYIQFVRFAPEGPVIESCVPFGASDRKDSPHFDDQVELFINQKTKPMTLDLEKVKAKAERSYSPGQ